MDTIYIVAKTYEEIGGIGFETTHVCKTIEGAKQKAKEFKGRLLICSDPSSIGWNDIDCVVIYPMNLED